MKIFDLHCDTATELYYRNLPFENSETHINAQNTAEHEAIQCFAVFFPEDENSLSRKDFFSAVTDTVFPQLHRPGLTPILTAEGVGVMAEEEGWIDLLSARDCRMASLVWNGENPLATGAITDDESPLTPRGREAAAELLRRGITLDISHLSRRGAEDLLSLTDKPLLASHSNARAITPHLRNLTDETAREIFRRGGLVGLNLYPPFLSQGDGATAADLLRHAEHFLSLGGENGLALGCDFDGVEVLPAQITGFGDLPKIYKIFSETFGKETADNIFYNNAARFFGFA